MDAIKKKMIAMKTEKENALDRAEQLEQKLRDTEEEKTKVEDELSALQKKHSNLENEFDSINEKYQEAQTKLEAAEKAASEDSVLSVQSVDITSELLNTDSVKVKKKKTGVKKGSKKKKAKTVEDNVDGEKVGKIRKEKKKGTKKKSDTSERPEPEGGNAPVSRPMDDFERIIYSNEPLFSDLELSDEEGTSSRGADASRTSRPRGAMIPCIPLGLMGMQSSTMIKFAIIGTEIQNVLQVSLRRTLKDKMQCLRDEKDKLLDENETLTKKCEAERARSEAAEQEVQGLNRRIQLLEEDLERSEERLQSATEKLEEASKAADESERGRKVLDKKTQIDEERLEMLEAKAKQTEFLAQDAEAKACRALSNKSSLDDGRIEALESNLKQTEFVTNEAEQKYEEVWHYPKDGRKVLESRNVSDDERIDALEQQLKEAKYVAEDADRKYDEVTIMLVPRIITRNSMTTSLVQLNRKVLENLNNASEERSDVLEKQLSEAKWIAEEADKKYDEAARKCMILETELEKTEMRCEQAESKCKALEEELHCTSYSLKSLEQNESQGKVALLCRPPIGPNHAMEATVHGTLCKSMSLHLSSKIINLEEELTVVGANIKTLQVQNDQASQREDSYEETIRDLTQRLKDAENRATEAERTVSKLQKEVDRLEDELLSEKERYKAISDELDQTFAELAGY
ncbi:hypothetical protein FSP39_001980 [Pinctada imbricata]|uniref:Tropomyosin n=1 Tax=Pinctada imbricata TaxID=66713 RepID=A0AA89BZP3_PINIB|nr:hypothetical protein FSP39_001980 [Pinctada imbricata]